MGHLGGSVKHLPWLRSGHEPRVVGSQGCGIEPPHWAPYSEGSQLFPPSAAPSACALFQIRSLKKKKKGLNQSREGSGVIPKTPFNTSAITLDLQRTIHF